MRVVRNFYLKGEVDGRATKLEGGPRSKDGGMTFRLYARNEGQVEEILSVGCWVCEDGKGLRITIDGFDGRMWKGER